MYGYGYGAAGHGCDPGCHPGTVAGVGTCKGAGVGGFALILVLFILLVIIGASFVGY
ncbi:YjcZ family sporulation protein [Salipaludibacillus sp. LMS25]|jgi:uncharacterized protein (TIGR01732 family)|uniref:YjcZ family sporulation protein n=1 Tax=Salipaludibacillus sp. LMS25 TaxID=2924031 RepID=UPI0020D04124|nr:YjcZ family sporulation protein [Salipaludibacillus sp. LMS25]UTR14109.1 YjcZ family sporulation protein [Salipaludibacillus sp. LMS25]